jgi:hypothetical protein
MAESVRIEKLGETHLISGSAVCQFTYAPVFFPTASLRWFREGGALTLQQAWQADNGEIEWRDIDIVDTEDEA